MLKLTQTLVDIWKKDWLHMVLQKGEKMVYPWTILVHILLFCLTVNDYFLVGRVDWFDKRTKVWDPTLVRGGNEAFLLRVWKSLLSRRVLRTLRESSKGKAQRGQYLLVVGLGCYKWYQMRQRWRWAHEGVDCEIPHWFEGGGWWDPTSVRGGKHSL